MGTYLNPGKAGYEDSVMSEIFIDKSDMINHLNSVVSTEQKYICISRPRRFGKTIATKMICAYYDRTADSREMFEKLNVATKAEEGVQWDINLGRFDVIRIIMTDFVEDGFTVKDALDELTNEVVDELLEAFPDIHFEKRPSLSKAMGKIFASTGRKFVIVIDEWDAIFRVYPDDKEGQNQYLRFLSRWLKDKPYVALAYMTGILPIRKYGEHSTLNMFEEFSMMSPVQFAPFTGFTEEEVKEICEKHNMDFSKVSSWYDGYTLRGRIPEDKRAAYREGTYDGNLLHVYCPLSVVLAATRGEVVNYWSKTETYEALSEYIRRDFDGLRESVAVLIDGGRIKIDTSTYQNDMTSLTCRDDVLSLLIHLGYLGYDSKRSEVFIPNREILDEFKTSTNNSEWTDTFNSFRTSLELLDATWAGDADTVAELVEKAHNQVDNKTYHDEAALNYAIRLAYYAAQKYYTPIPEMDTGKGYADVVYLPSPEYPDKPALVIELKYNKSPQSGLDQIIRQKYADRLDHYKGNTLLVAINYDSDARNDDPDYKRHSCRIEKV